MRRFPFIRSSFLFALMSLGVSASSSAKESRFPYRYCGALYAADESHAGEWSVRLSVAAGPAGPASLRLVAQNAETQAFLDLITPATAPRTACAYSHQDAVPERDGYLYQVAQIKWTE